MRALNSVGFYYSYIEEEERRRRGIVIRRFVESRRYYVNLIYASVSPSLIRLRGCPWTPCAILCGLWSSSFLCFVLLYAFIRETVQLCSSEDAFFFCLSLPLSIIIRPTTTFLPTRRLFALFFFRCPPLLTKGSRSLSSGRGFWFWEITLRGDR